MCCHEINNFIGAMIRISYSLYMYIHTHAWQSLSAFIHFISNHVTFQLTGQYLLLQYSTMQIQIYLLWQYHDILNTTKKTITTKISLNNMAIYYCDYSQVSPANPGTSPWNLYAGYTTRQPARSKTLSRHTGGKKKSTFLRKKKKKLSWYSVDQIVPVHWSDLYAGSNSMCKLKESCKNYEKTIDKSLP